SVIVRDTGIGIAPDVLPHLFEVFTQADHSLDRSRGGLGLGLALVKGLVELHGGQGQASSPGLGCGAEFTFWVPLGTEPQGTGDTPAPIVTSGRQLRILIVEDNRDTATTLRMLLARHGHEVMMAYSGPSGVEIAKEWRPHVVLCD